MSLNIHTLAPQFPHNQHFPPNVILYKINVLLRCIISPPKDLLHISVWYKLKQSFAGILHVLVLCYEISQIHDLPGRTVNEFSKRKAFSRILHQTPQYLNLRQNDRVNISEDSSPSASNNNVSFWSTNIFSGPLNSMLLLEISMKCPLRLERPQPWRRLFCTIINKS